MTIVLPPLAAGTCACRVTVEFAPTLRASRKEETLASSENLFTEEEPFLK
jgi:hypothetical protein